MESTEYENLENSSNKKNNKYGPVATKMRPHPSLPSYSIQLSGRIAQQALAAEPTIV